jgi:hypothetical protein
MSKPSIPALNRRTALLSAGAAGTLAAAATMLPKAPAVVTQVAEAVPTNSVGGYQVTEHVKRYYATARI